MSGITIDMLCDCQWEPKNKRKQHCNKEIGPLFVAVTRRESGCFKTNVTDEKKPVTQ